jgi:hypothetical protein
MRRSLILSAICVAGFLNAAFVDSTPANAQQCTGCDTAAGGQIKLRRPAQGNVKIGTWKGYDIIGVFGPKGRMVDYYLRAPDGSAIYGSNLVIANHCFEKTFKVWRITQTLRICVTVELL